jgi:hypothetical protein
VTSQFSTLVSYRSSALLPAIRLIVLATQSRAVLHAGFRVTCDSFLNLRLCFSRLFTPGRSLFWYESVILRVDSLYAEATEAVKSWAALSASYRELIRIPGKINSETKL